MTWYRKTTPILAGTLLLLSAAAACDRDVLRPDADRAATARGARSLNPACSGGGTTHPADTVTSTQHWTAAGNPHHVTGIVHVRNGAQLRIQPGSLVCFAAAGGIRADDGGRLSVNGDDTARVVLTAADEAAPWSGIELRGSPAAASYAEHALIEHNGGFILAAEDHLLLLEAVHVRRSGAVELRSRRSRILRSTVDTTRSGFPAAVFLGDSARFNGTTVRGAPGVGVVVDGVGVTLTAGRIEGSGGVGLFAWPDASVVSSDPVRVVGGASYPVEVPVAVLSGIWQTVAEQDSLLGNARDTVVITGGTLRNALYAGPNIPWRLNGLVFVSTNGTLRAQPGARIASDWGLVQTQGGGRVVARGTASDPVVFTAVDPARGWFGIRLFDAPSSASFLTNVVVEHVLGYWTAVLGGDGHPVVIDSAVIRLSGSAVTLMGAGSRISRSRVDTTLDADRPAVDLRADAKLESTLVRGSAGWGIEVWSPNVRVVSCEVRESAGEGFRLYYPVAVHDCNLVDNGGVGIVNHGGSLASATDNWWGDAAGPFAPGGDGASGPLTVSPWRTAPFVLPYVP